MLLTLVRENFRRNSKPEIVENCLERLGLSFVIFTKIVHDNVNIDEQPSEFFDLKNWKTDFEKNQLVNEKFDVVLNVPSNLNL